MAYGQEQSLQQPQHLLRLENKRRFLAEGIAEVLSYDDGAIAAEGAFGRILLQGKGLHIISFDKAGGRLSGEGEIESVHYVSAEQPKKGLLQRLLK